MKKLLALAGFVSAVALFMTVLPPAEEAEAGPWLGYTEAFEVTCGATATRIAPESGLLAAGKIHGSRCFMSKETPDDSSSCACIGGSNVNYESACYPVGGCARAYDASWSVNGDTFCVAEDGEYADGGPSGNEVKIVCIAGQGVP